MLKGFFDRLRHIDKEEEEFVRQIQSSWIFRLAGSEELPRKRLVYFFTILMLVVLVLWVIRLLT
jgi:hypothetical protein